MNLDLLAAKASVTLGRVHFNSAPEAVRALLGGDLEAAVVGPPALISPVQAGSVRVLGAFEEDRNPNFPDAPTFRELGYDIVLGGYFFIIAPRGTPDSVVDTLHGVFMRATEDEQFRTIVTRSGFVLDYQDGAILGLRLAKDYELFGELVSRQQE